ncbi:hypothetical protein VTO42DRAFT_3372 [Malbranchea cinnamomea]
MGPGVESAPNSTSSNNETVDLQILSPSLDTPQRFTLNGLPLSTKVSEVKARITLAVPSRPDPETQRLIYKGRVLSNNDEILSNIVDQHGTGIHSMHLVLPPSAVPPPRPALHSSTPPPAIHLSGQPLQQNTALRYRRPHGASADSVQLFSQVVDFESQNSSSGIQLGAPQNTTTSRVRLSTGLASGAQRRAELAERLRSMTRDVAMATTPLSVGDESGPGASSSPLHARFVQTGPPPSSNTTLHQSSFANTAQPPDSPSRHHLTMLFQRLIAMENQLAANIAPTVEEISRVRLQLHQLLDQQYRYPLQARQVPLESWLSQLSNIAIRADQIRMNQARAAHAAPHGGIYVTGGSDPSHSQMYLLSSPDGPYGIVMSPAGFSGTWDQSLTTFGNSSLGQLPNVGSRGPPPLQPRFRIGIHTYRRPRRRFITALNLFRITRGIWIFIRLFVICYLLAPHGTWSRIVSFFLAAIIAVLSQTRWPRRAQRALWDPIRRHLENLVLLDHPHPQILRHGHGAQRGDATTGSNTMSTGQEPRPTGTDAPTSAPTFMQGVRESIVQAERGVALFLATLVPGVGERYIAARNAADRAREEAERQRQQHGETEQQQQNADNGAAASSTVSVQSRNNQTESPSVTRSNTVDVQPRENGAEGAGQQPVDSEQA